MRVLEFDTASGSLCGEIFNAASLPAQHGVPDGRVMIGLPDGMAVASLSTYRGTPPLVDDWTWSRPADDVDNKLTPPQVPARTWIATAADAFTPPAPPVKSNKVSKTAFLGVIPPALYKAWKTSDDAILMYALALFEADTSVDLANPAIGQVFVQAQALNLIDGPTAAAIQQRIAGLLG